MDRKLLAAVIEKFGGGPVGVENLAAAIGEERDTIEDVLEPFLIQQGYLQRTPRGRMATRTRLPAFRPRARPRPAPRGELCSMTPATRGEAASPRSRSSSCTRSRCASTTRTPTRRRGLPRRLPQVPRARAHRVAAPAGLRPPGARARASRDVRGDLARDRLPEARAAGRQARGRACTLESWGQRAASSRRRSGARTRSLVRAKVTVACVTGESFRPAEIPAPLNRKMEAAT